jgi:hypothetical protein
LAVRHEKPVDVIASELRGIAKESWLGKWSRWLDQLLDVYGVEDPAEVLGITDIYDLEKLEEFLIERCGGLTESECLKEVEKDVRERGYRRKVTEEVVESVMDYVKSVERKPELLYGLPTDVRAEVERFRAKPELNGGKAYELVFNFMVKEGVDPEEAKKIAEEIAKTIPKLPPKDRAKVVEDVIGVVKLAKQRTLDYYVKQEAKAKEVVKEAEKGKPLNERVVYGLIEEYNVELQKQPTLGDLWDRLVAMGFDVGNLKELVESLKRKGMIVEEDGKYVVKYLKEVKVEKPKVERRVERKAPPMVFRTYEERLPEHLRTVYRRWMELLGG